MVTTLFSQEHEALREVVRRWVERDGDERARQWEAEGSWPREALRAVAAQGWFATMLPEAHGGDPLAAVVVWEELGRLRSAGVVHDLLGQATAGALLARLGAGDAESALAGELIVTLVGGPVLRPDGAGSRVTGQAPSLSNGAWAERLVVVARAGDGFVIAVVPADADGVTRVPPAAPMGRRAGRVADIALTDVPIERRDALADGVDAAVALTQIQASFRLHHAAATVAGAWRTWEDAKAYALQREAFGRPIGKFQVNRHALAEMAARLTAARALVRDTAWRMAGGALDAGETAALRLHSTRLAVEVTDRCLQLHGGYGYTSEFDVSRAWRDARHLPHDEAGLDALHDEVAAALEGAVHV